VSGVPRWLRPALAIVGLVISVYLTLLHYVTSVPLYCSNSGAVNCEQVLTSPQSVVLGLPVAAWGLAWFIVAVWLLWGGGGAGWRAQAANLWTVVGAITVVYLVYTELIVIGKICLWCTSIHVIVLAIFVLQTLAAPRPDAG
jgi:uncharacterized membrane protein